MWKYWVIYTFLISYGKNPKTETYQRNFKADEKEAAVAWYNDRLDECFCDSVRWKFITRSERKEGAIIMVEIDSLK